MNRLKQCRYGPMVFPINDQFVGGSFEHYGEFSEGEVALFRCLLRPGATVLEVGANLGAHTVPLAQIVGSQGTVHAFEPQRSIYYFLCANVALNHLTNVICHQLAVGETAGSLAVPELDYTRPGNFGALNLECVCDADAYQVPVIRIDDLPLDRCDLIKVDVEGMEKRVVEGAVQTLLASSHSCTSRTTGPPNRRPCAISCGAWATISSVTCLPFIHPTTLPRIRSTSLPT